MLIHGAEFHNASFGWLGGSISQVVQYADATWNCNGASPPCPGCSTVPSGTSQSPYGCAPYVAHSLAAGGFVATDASPFCGSLSKYVVTLAGVSYDLNCVAKQDTPCTGGSPGLTDYLLATGWKATTATPIAGTVCAVRGSADWGHIVLAVGNNICNAHNHASYHVSCNTWVHNLCLNPPNTNFCTGKTNGNYCDPNNANNYVTCTSGAESASHACSFTCIESATAGKSYCAVAPGSCVNTNQGDYCGSDKIGSPQYPNVLFRCINKLPQGAHECPNKCNIGAGVNDFCT